MCATLCADLQNNTVLVISTEDYILTGVHTSAYHVSRGRRTKLVASWAGQGEKCEVIGEHLFIMY